MAESCSSSSCGGGAPARQAARAWTGPATIAGACGLACMAAAVTPLVWPLAALAAGLGAYRAVAAKGCGAAAAPGAPAALGRAARRARLRVGLGLLAVTGVLVAEALCGWAVLWPLALVAGWFGASFVVAGLTGYAGCPELGAIPSLVRRRPIATRCPPLARD